MWRIALILSMALGSGSVAAFDCNGVKFPPAVVICSDPELIRPTDERQQAINEARARIGEQAWPALWEDQKRWVPSYATACGVPSDRAPPDPVPASIRECFKQAGETRIAYLRPYAVTTGATLVASPTEPSASGRIGPSYDCGKATTPLTLLICGDPELSRLDLQFGQAYWALFQQLDQSHRKSLTEEDLSLIDQVQDRCGLPRAGALTPEVWQTRDCVRAGYENMRRTWISRLTGAAREEAERPLDEHVALQRDLQQLGFIPAGSVDGVYGRDTRAAIVAWQTSRGRAVTGFLGNSDAAALGSESPAGPQPVAQQRQQTEAGPAIGARKSENAGFLSVRLTADTKRNKEFTAVQDGWGAYVAYRVRPQGDVLKIDLNSVISAIWKGGAVVTEQPFDEDGYIEDPSQFAPVLLMLEVANDTTQPTQITGAFLDVTESATDYQPYLEIGDWARVECAEATYAPSFEVRNLGWGKVLDAHMRYAFSKTGKISQPAFDNVIGTFDQKTTATVDEGVEQSGVNLTRIRTGKFHCTSELQVPACFERLKATGIFGNLAGQLYTKGSGVFTHASGHFEYHWTDNTGELNETNTPFDIVIPIMHFDVGGLECGAPGPGERDYKPITLSLDRKNYRLPLNIRGQLASRQNRSFGFALVAPKSSHHVFRVVLQLADGTSVASMPADLSYFIPRMPPSQ